MEEPKQKLDYQKKKNKTQTFHVILTQVDWNLPFWTFRILHIPHVLANSNSEALNVPFPLILAQQIMIIWLKWWHLASCMKASSHAMARKVEQMCLLFWFFLVFPHQLMCESVQDALEQNSLYDSRENKAATQGLHTSWTLPARPEAQLTCCRPDNPCDWFLYPTCVSCSPPTGL